MLAARRIQELGGIVMLMKAFWKKWCFISPISSHLTITTWLHAKFGTFTLRIEEKHDEETL